MHATNKTRWIPVVRETNVVTRCFDRFLMARGAAVVASQASPGCPRLLRYHRVEPLHGHPVSQLPKARCRAAAEPSAARTAYVARVPQSDPRNIRHSRTLAD